MLAFVLAAVVAADSVVLEPRPLYEAVFATSVVSGNSIERYPQLKGMMPYYVSRPRFSDVWFPAVNWRFADAAGKEVRRPGEGSSGVTVVSEAKKEMAIRFYAPELATNVKFAAYPNGKNNKVKLRMKSVRQVETGTSLNVNPRFDMSADLLPGWQLTGGARYLPGVGVETVGGSAFSDPFPVEPGMKLSLTMEGTVSKDIDTHNRLVCVLHYLRRYEDGATRKYVTAVNMPCLEGRATSVTEDVVVPDGVKWLRFAVHGGLVRRVEIREVK